ncbi:hypothetical protein KKB40_00635 [Patescibacteria group bacterium]|nr:hypothetical protein [Patescibacteria group bacterium]
MNTNPVQKSQQPPQQPEQAVVTDQQKAKRKPKLLKFLLTTILITLILVSSFLSYSIAYEKISIQQFPEAQQKIRHFVQNISFMPKTPKFLLEKSAIAHQEVTKHSFDISAALDSGELTSSLGVGSLDLVARGQIDYSDSKNLLLNMNASLTRDFNLDVKKKDDAIYFKINKIPPLLLAFLDLQPELLEPFLKNWIIYDSSKLDTSARKEIEAQERKSLSAKFLEESVQKYFDDTVFAKTKVETVEEDRLKFYKLTVDADADLINHIGELIAKESKENLPPPEYEISEDQKTKKLSDTIKSLSWEIYIDKENYYTQKIVMSASIELNQAVDAETAITNPMLPLLNNSTANFALVIKFADFGKPVIVQTPTETISFENFITQIMEMYVGSLEGVETSEVVPL